MIASMGYVLIEHEWCKKNSAKRRHDTPKVSMSVTNPVFCKDKDIEELKGRVSTIEERIANIQELTTNLIQLTKEISTNIGKVQLYLDSFK